MWSAIAQALSRRSSERDGAGRGRLWCARRAATASSRFARWSTTCPSAPRCAAACARRPTRWRLVSRPLRDTLRGEPLWRGRAQPVRPSSGARRAARAAAECDSPGSR
eukprot:Amastigsp_a1439_94.p6 type:complete len:108 gc:universal Amastigsp_a1439_94:999-676(-)